MIMGVGVDIAEVERFKKWEDYSEEQLKRVFSEREILYCKQNGTLNYMCLASRFAAKEAFFKALSSMLVKLKFTEKEFSFLWACKHIEVEKGAWSVPILKINWNAFEEMIGKKIPEVIIDFSLSHEQSAAIAFVVLSS
jgi:holo-[acyl-carrier protein] synthase